MMWPVFVNSIYEFLPVASMQIAGVLIPKIAKLLDSDGEQSYSQHISNTSTNREVKLNEIHRHFID